MIHRRLDELAAKISDDYRDRELTVIAILNGSVILMADLLRRIPLPLKLDCLSVASYREKIETAAPQSIRICVLLEKKKTRLRHVDADYVGFQIADEFVVGYGLDYMERYRNLPCIGVLRKDL